jgi:ATP-binding cassette subfamily C protein CydCD
MSTRLLKLTRDARFALTLTILCGFIAGLLTIWQAFILSGVIRDVFLLGQTLGEVIVALRSILVIIILRALLGWGGDVAANALAIRIKNDLRKGLFTHLFRLGPAYTRGERTGELTAAAVEGVEALDAYFSGYLPQLVLAALIPLSILAFVFPLDLISGIVLLFTAPLIPLFMILIGKAAEALTRRQYETLSRLSAFFLDSLQGLTTLKLFGASRARAKSITEVNDRFRDATLGVLRVTFLSALVLEMVAMLGIAIVAVEVGIRLLYGAMGFQQALFLLVIAPEFYMPLRALGLRFHAGMSGTTAAKRIFAILDEPLPTMDREKRLEAGVKTRAGVGYPSSIIFENVSFTYPGEIKPALQNIDLEIGMGRHLALVGASGAGKSTFASLLLRFIEPTDGFLTCDGIRLASIPADDWRRQIAWVPQRPYLFHDTIAANIRLAKPDAADGAMIAAAQAAHLDDFINSLPDGYETVIGEAGARLSGGEGQRLALARAFLKDAPVLILDEPTSNLDPELESRLADSVQHLVRGHCSDGRRRTVITIAHRLATVACADRIVLLEEGRVVETGSHRELLETDGRYARLFRASAADGEEEIQEEDRKDIGENGPVRMTSGPVSLPAPSEDHLQSTVLRLLGFLNGAWTRVAVSVLLGAATIAAGIGLMGTSAYLISAAALHPSIADLQVAIVGVRFFGIARGLLRYLERLVSHNVTFRLLARLRTWFYEALEPLAPARLMQFRGGDLLARVVADVETLEHFYVRVVAPPLVALIVTVGMSLLLGSYDPSLGWSLLGFLLLLGVAVPLLTGRLARGPGRDLVACRADLHVQLVDGIQGMADLVAFGRQADRQRRIELIGSAASRAQRLMSLVTGSGTALGILLTHLGMLVIVALAIPLVTVGRIPAVAVAGLALMTLASFEAVSPLPYASQMLGTSKEAARRLFDIVDARPAVSEESPALNDLRPPDDRRSGNVQLKFHNVNFAYPGENENALSDISFELSEGRSIAIVGPSGAGKSTIVNLLLRFWDYEGGEVTLAGRSLKDMASDEVRRLMAVIPQNAYLFNATIAQNLLIANAQATQAQVEAAAQQAQIHDFIASLPEGYDTFVGEQGLRLSGGERQRLAIARGLLKDAPILILDEPTANLDPGTERAVLDVLFDVMMGRTTLMITHRLERLARFSEILVLSHGRVVERGSHATLLARCGLYRKMWAVQNRIRFADLQ